MVNFTEMLRINKIAQLCLILIIFVVPITQSSAKSGCCSHHGGVSGCNSETGFQQCKDGSTSPSCKCDSSSATPIKSNKQSTTKQTQEEVAPAASTEKSSATNNKTKGCCSRHGGVAQCNKSTGHQMCKDGSQSTTCTCS